jgi:hypothetical protein
LQDEVDFLDALFRGRRGRLALKSPFHCRRAYEVTSQCSGHGRLPSWPGKPNVVLSGTYRLVVAPREPDLGTGTWRPTMRATLSWRRCPARLNPPQRLVGRPCHKTKLWQHGQLSGLFSR